MYFKFLNFGKNRNDNIRENVRLKSYTNEFLDKIEVVPEEEKSDLDIRQLSKALEEQNNGVVRKTFSSSSEGQGQAMIQTSEQLNSIDKEREEKEKAKLNESYMFTNEFWGPHKVDTLYLTEAEKCYVAGLLDGFSGEIVVQWVEPEDLPDDPYVHISISFYQRKEKVFFLVYLKRILSNLGILRQVNKSIFEYNISGSHDVELLLSNVRPYMRLKYQAVDLMLRLIRKKAKVTTRLEYQALYRTFLVLKDVHYLLDRPQNIRDPKEEAYLASLRLPSDRSLEVEERKAKLSFLRHKAGVYLVWLLRDLDFKRMLPHELETYRWALNVIENPLQVVLDPYNYRPQSPYENKYWEEELDYNLSEAILNLGRVPTLSKVYKMRTLERMLWRKRLIKMSAKDGFLYPQLIKDWREARRRVARMRRVRERYSRRDWFTEESSETMDQFANSELLVEEKKDSEAIGS